MMMQHVNRLLSRNFGAWGYITMALLAGTGACPPAALAQAPQLTVDQVMAKYIAATGGRAAYEKITSTVVKGTMEIAPNGLKGEFTAQAKTPNLVLVTQTIAGIGEIRQGYDGKTGWSQDPLAGLRTLEGKELATLIMEAAFNAPLRWKQIYKSAQMLGVKQVDGKKVYAIKFTPPQGNAITQYFDVKTFLLVGTDTLQESPQGTMPVHSIMSDYRMVDGVKEPFLVHQKVGPADVALKTTEVKNNVELDAAIFAKPTEAKADSKK